MNRETCWTILCACAIAVLIAATAHGAEVTLTGEVVGTSEYLTGVPVNFHFHISMTQSEELNVGYLLITHPEGWTR